MNWCNSVKYQERTHPKKFLSDVMWCHEHKYLNSLNFRSFLISYFMQLTACLLVVSPPIFFSLSFNFFFFHFPFFFASTSSWQKVSFNLADGTVPTQLGSAGMRALRAPAWDVGVGRGASSISCLSGSTALQGCFSTTGFLIIPVQFFLGCVSRGVSVFVSSLDLIKIDFLLWQFHLLCAVTCLYISRRV